MVLEDVRQSVMPGYLLEDANPKSLISLVFIAPREIFSGAGGDRIVTNIVRIVAARVGPGPRDRASLLRIADRPGSSPVRPRFSLSTILPPPVRPPRSLRTRPEIDIKTRRSALSSRTSQVVGGSMSQPKRRREACRLPPSDALGTALWLVAQGLWALAITPPEDDRSPNPGKAPIGRGWGTRRLSTRALFAIFARQPRAGVGVVLGPASGVVDLEVDDPERAQMLLGELFPDGPPPTMGWSSRRGEHRLYRWDDRLSAARSAVVHLAGGALELRLGAGGKQVAAVCPPSPRADGSPRIWNGIWE